MNAAVTIKGAFSIGWVFLATALLMVLAVSDHYPGGYETMLTHASVLFILGAVVSLTGLVVGAVWQRSTVSPGWLTLGGLQVLASLLVIFIVFLLSRGSQ
jgi:hypothetical protein